MTIWRSEVGLLSGRWQMNHFHQTVPWGQVCLPYSVVCVCVCRSMGVISLTLNARDLKGGWGPAGGSTVSLVRDRAEAYHYESQGRRLVAGLSS